MRVSLRYWEYWAGRDPEGQFAQSGRGTRNAKKPLKGFQGCDKNGLNESFKMSPHLICLSWHFNFHIISRPDPEAGHKRDLGCQPRPIKWGLISQLSLRAISWHPWKPLRGFFAFRVPLTDCVWNTSEKSLVVKSYYVRFVFHYRPPSLGRSKN